MATTYFDINFNATLFSEENKSLSDFTAEIEYYSVQDNQWTSLISGTTDNSGVYELSFNLPARISKNDENTRAIKDVISSGGIPMFRMVTNASKKVNHIIASLSRITIDNEKLIITIDFGTIWLLPKEQWMSIEKNYTLIASTHYHNKQDLDECNTQLKRVTAEIKKVKEEKADLSDKLKKSDAQLNSVNKNLTDCDKEREKKEEDLSKLLIDYSSVNDKLSDCEANDYEGLLLKYTTLLDNHKDCDKNLQIAKKQVTDHEEKITDLSNEIERKKKAYEKLEEVNKKSIDELEQCEIDLEACNKLDGIGWKSKHKILTEEYKQLEETLEHKVEDFNQAVIEKATIQAQLDEAIAFNESDNPNKVGSSKVYSSIATELQQANESLAGSNYRLANVKLNLKALVNKSPNGMNFELIDSASAKNINGATVSTVEIDISSQPAQNSTSEIPVPNVLGLTETAVRKKLQLYGLKLKPAYQSILKNDGKTIGQSFKQLPEAGEPGYVNQLITVFFAKNKTT